MSLPDVPEVARRANRRLLRHLGYGRVPAEVGERPTGPVRSASEVLDRALAVHVVVTVANGFDVEVGFRWATALDVRFLPDEVEYLEDVKEGIGLEDAVRQTSVEALALLLWALDVYELPPDAPAAEAAQVLPVGAPIDVIEAVRPVEEILVLHDLLAGMAWALRDDTELEIGDAPGSVDPYVVRQRHRASSWLLGADW